MFQTLDSKGNDEKGEPDNSQQFGPIVLFPAKIFGRRLRLNHNTGTASDASYKSLEIISLGAS